MREPTKSRKAHLHHFPTSQYAHQAYREVLTYLEIGAPSSCDPFTAIGENKLQENRPEFDSTSPIEVTKSPNPAWKYGKKTTLPSSTPIRSSHISIDPFASDRALTSNYRLLISGIPRPISLISTASVDGKKNLAPFSYFQVIDHDPPTFVVGFSARADRVKDTRRNLIEMGECVINIVSEHMIEGANTTSLDIEFGTSECELSRFTMENSETGQPKRVKEAVFSLQGKLVEMIDLKKRAGAEKEGGKPTGALAIIEATRFWARGDATNEAKDEVALETSRPLVQLEGMSYGRVRETIESPRPNLKGEPEDEESSLANILRKKRGNWEPGNGR